jgi:hypothetical protein
MKRLRLSKPDRLLLGILFLLAVLAAVVTILLRPPTKTGGADGKPSSFFNATYGTKASLLVLRQLGYRVEQLRRPFSAATLAPVDGLVILDPLVTHAAWEVDTLRNWLREGHRLLIVPQTPDGGTEDETEGLADWFQVEPVRRPTGSVPQTLTARLSERAERDRLLRGIKQLTADRRARFDAATPLGSGLRSATAEVLWVDRDGIVAIRVPLGKGEIVALADAYPLSNRGLREGDNGLLLANLADELSGGATGVIAWDEYHHGFVQREASPQAILRMVLTGPWGYAAAQASLVGILALLAAGARFGRPRDIVRLPRRRQREFVRAAGELLDDARATRLVYRTLADYYRQRLCRAVHLSSGVDDATLCRTVRQSSDVPITWIPPHDDSAARHETPSRSELLAQVQQWHKAACRVGQAELEDGH